MTKNVLPDITRQDIFLFPAVNLIQYVSFLTSLVCLWIE